MRTVSIALIMACSLGMCAMAADLYDEPSAVLDERLDSISSQSGGKWLITPYRLNFIMPVTYWFDTNNQPLKDQAAATGETSDKEFEHVEIKFQISFMAEMLGDLTPVGGDLYFAYSQVSYWQAYNDDLSEAFRDTNYEPEMFLQFRTDTEILGMNSRLITLGLVHQSNGRGTDVLTRSWNRAYALFMLERGNFVLSLKPWLILDDAENPDIEEYLGCGEVRGTYKLSEDHHVQVMLRNNMMSDDNRTTVELTWTFPLHRQMRGVVQYFNGYGESLLDYDDHSQRLGVGVTLNDWF